MEFSNHLVQLQWRCAILKQLESTLMKDEATLDLKHPQVTSIISGLESPSLSTSLSCCSVFVSMVTLKWLDASSALRTLVSAASGAPHLPPVIHAVAEVLAWQGGAWQGGAKEGDTRNRYSLRMNAHPFISIFSSNPDSGLYLVREAVSMLSRGRGLDSFPLLEPFLKYVFLHTSLHLATLSHHLHNQLVGVVRHALMSNGSKEYSSYDQTISVAPLMELLVGLLPLQPSKSTSEALTLVAMVTNMVEVVSVMPGGIGLRGDLTDHCLSLISELTIRDIPTLELIESVVSLVNQMEEFGSPGHILCVSWLLLRHVTEPQVVAQLLALCNRMGSKVIAFGPLLVLPLVQLLSQPRQSCDQSHDFITTNQNTASHLLDQIQQSLLPDLKTTPLLEHHPYCHSSHHPYRHSSHFQSLANMYLLLSADSAQLIQFMHQFSKWLSLSPRCHDLLVLVLSALAVRVGREGEGDLAVRVGREGEDGLAVRVDREGEGDLAVGVNREGEGDLAVRVGREGEGDLAVGVGREGEGDLAVGVGREGEGGLAVGVGREGEGGTYLKDIVRALTSTAGHDPTLAPSLLPFLIHLLSCVSCPHSKLAILHSIPNLAVHKLTTSAVVSTILALGESPSLVSLATVLYGRVWQLQDDVFPSLLAYLTPHPLQLKGQREVDLSRGAVIRDLCLVRPEQHGEVLLGLIHRYLLPRRSGDPVVVAMAIDGLVSLCKCDVVDVVTLWNVIGEGLAQDNRPVVAVALCSLLELAADYLDTDIKQSHKVFKMTSLKILLRFMFESRHSRVCSAALNSLARFSLADLFLDMVPASVMSCISTQSQDLELSHGTSHEVVLTGLHLVNMFHLVPTDSLFDHAHLLSGFLGEEISSFGRGVISTAVKHAQEPSPTERLLKSLTQSLQLSLRALPAGGLARTTVHRAALSLAGVKGQTDGLREGGKTAIKEKLTQHLSLLSSCIKEGVVYLELESSGDWCLGLSGMEVVKEWKMFMGGLVPLLEQIHDLDKRVVSVEDETNSLSEGENWGFRAVVEKLEELAKSHDHCTENVIMALVGVVSYQSSHLIGQSDHTANIERLIRLLAARGVHNAAILSLPTLVETAVLLLVRGVLPWDVSYKLVSLTVHLINTMDSWSLWCTPLVTNSLIQLTSPISHEVGIAVASLMPLLIGAEQAGLDLLCKLSALIPSFCGCGHSTPSAGHTLISVLSNKLSTLAEDYLSLTVVKLCSLNLTFGLVTIFTVGELSDEEVMNSISLLADLATKAPQEGVYHLCVGVALCGVMRVGHSRSVGVSDSIAAQWLQELSAATEGGDVEKVTPLLWGLSSLLGLFQPIRMSVGEPRSYIRTLFPLVMNSFEKVIQSFPGSLAYSTALWLLTQLQGNISNYFSLIERVPQEYGFLPESSILRNLHKLLEGCHGNLTPAGMKLSCAILQTVSSVKGEVPPMDWSRLLIPCLRAALCSRDRDQLQREIVSCLKRASGFQQLMVYCVQPLIVGHLQVESLCFLLNNLWLLIQTLTHPALSLFLHTLLSSSLLLHNLPPSPLSQPLPPSPLSKPLPPSPLSKSMIPVFSLVSGIHDVLTSASADGHHRNMISTVLIRLYHLLMSKEPVFICLIQEGLREDVSKLVLGKLAECVNVCDPALVAVPVSKDIALLGCYGAAMECCLVLKDIRRFTDLGSTLELILNNTDCPRVVPSFIFLLRTVYLCCTAPEPSTLNQTETLHMLLMWTRSHKASTNQMAAILTLAHFAVTTDLSLPSCGHQLHFAFIHYLQAKETNPVSLQQLFGVLQGKWVEPKSAAVREKLCQCLLEWFGSASGDRELRKTMIEIFSALKSCSEYRAPLIWTSVGHLM